MITRLKIENFKSHRSTELKLNNLTLLTGLNGCGKTSTIQALLLLRQSFKKGRLMQGLDLNSPLVNVGIVHEALSQFSNSPVIKFEIDNDEEPFVFSFDAASSLKDSFMPKMAYSGNITTEKLNTISLFNKNFQYISAMRWGGRSNFPKDTYMVDSEGQISDQKGQCELTGNYLFNNAGETTYNYIVGSESDNISLLDQTILWEQYISPGVTINVESSLDNNSFNIFYGFQGKGKERPVIGLRAENIGFGISYTLPVILALLSAKPGALLLIENPEAHLHPAGQAKLSQLMADAAQRGIQIIVETHSDHIINGVLVATKKYEACQRGIDRNKVGIYYFGNKDESNASINEKVEIIDGGRMSFQPKGFFDQIEEDTDFLNDYYANA